MISASVLLLVLFGSPVENSNVPTDRLAPEPTTHYRLMLEDPDPAVRREAVKEMRRFTSRFVRAGLRKVPQGFLTTPIADELLPLLTRAAEDEDVWVHTLALFALADTRDPVGAATLRSHLDDPDPEVRLRCACLLTEFGDYSGLAEIERALDRHRHGEPLGLMEAEHVLVALCRFTGGDPDSIPVNPMVSSSMSYIEQGRKAYDQRLLEWARWFEDGRK